MKTRHKEFTRSHYLSVMVSLILSILLSNAYATGSAVGQAQCAVEAAECGVVLDANGDTVECGTCNSGEMCAANRCEASCSLEQIDKGPMDSLVAYVPNQLTSSDQSGYSRSVTTRLLAADTQEEKEFPFVGRTDFHNRSLTVDFGGQKLESSMTVSFKLMPANDQQSETLIQGDDFSVSQRQNQLTAYLRGSDGSHTITPTGSLNTRSCNHVAIKIGTNSIQSFVNGNKFQQAANVQSLDASLGKLRVGPYAGKVWDLRVYNRELSDAEIATIGEDCDENKIRTAAFDGYSEYLCSVYQCIWWPEGTTDTSFDSFQYQVNAHDMTWEHNVLATGMYDHGNLCKEYAKPRDLKLDEGYRKSWVSKFNYDKPWNNYVLHENFHAYQRRANSGNKFLLESTANWGAYTQKPGDDGVKLLGMYTLQPHLPLYTDQSSPIADGVIDAYKGGHQYGAGIYQFYLTEYVLGPKVIGDSFNDERHYSEPVAVMYDAVANTGGDMRDVFIEFAARTTTWDYPDRGEQWAQAERNSYGRMVGQQGDLPDEEVDNKISVFYDVDGTGDQWATIPDRYRVGNWAFNAYQVDVTRDENYTVGLNTSVANDAGAEFRAKVVLHTEATGERQYFDLPVAAAGMDSSIYVPARAGDTLYLVVASTPSAKFSGWDTYSYDYLIQPGAQDDDDDDGDNDDGGDDDDTPKTFWEKLLDWLNDFLDWINSFIDDDSDGDNDGDDGDNNDGGDGNDDGNPDDGNADNHVPTATNMVVSLDESEAKSLTLEADDIDGDTLTFEITEQPAHGSLSGTPPNLVYQPDGGFTGNDQFTYRVSDDYSTSEPATISLMVSAIAQNNKPKVYLMAGQSNMVGHGSSNDLPAIDNDLNQTRSDVFIKSIISPNRGMDGLRPGYGYNNGKFGVELKFGQVMGETLDQDVYLFKAAQGGTTLDNVEHWRPLSHGGVTNNLYDQMTKGFDSFLSSELANVDYEIAGFIWFQGYNDTFGTENQYEQHLRNLLSAVRNDLNQPDLPVVIVQINDNRGPAGDIVMNAQAAVATEDNRNRLVVSGDQRPYYHYGSDSYVVIGERIAHEALAQLNLPSARPDQYTVAPGSQLDVTEANGLLANDEGSNPVATLVTQPAHGSITLAGNGAFVYIPDAGFQGQDSFEYKATVGSQSGNVANVKLWVRDSDNPLVMHYSFDDSSRTEINGAEAVVDSAAAINAVTVNTGVTFGHDGRFGEAAHFNGNGVLHYMTHYPVIDFLDLSTDQDFSIALWVKTDSAINQEQILISNKYYYGRNGGFALTTNDSGSIKGFISTYDHQSHAKAKVKISADQGVIDDGNWHHVALVAAFSDNQLRLFVDGQLVAEKDSSNLLGDINQYESAIGDGSGGGDGDSNGFTGYMDELRWYNKALSSQEVNQLAQ